MRTLIVPMCGKSTRFPGLKPKWLLTHPCGQPMWEVSIGGISKYFDRIILVVLNEHILKYEPNLHIDPKIEVCILLESANQPDTVQQALTIMNVTDNFVIKDVDNYFGCPALATNFGNFVGYTDISHTKKPANKSYISKTIHGDVLNIVEKKVISNEFCVGLYGFLDAKQFITHFEKFDKRDDIYVSDIIYSMLLKQTEHSMNQFSSIPVEEFLDWGTLEDWKDFCSQFSTYFCDLDGTLIWSAFESNPPYKEGGPIMTNIEALNKKYDSGCCIVLTTARPEAAREWTVKQLSSYGIKYNHLLMGLPHCKRVVINDFATSNPYPSCAAINISRNGQNLAELL